MASAAEQPSLILIQRLADGRVDWIPLAVPTQQVRTTAQAAYTLIDRANYEAPQTLVAQRVGEDLVVLVQGTQVLVLDGFFTTANVAFYPTTSVASGAGPFSGAPLTPDSPVSATSTGEQVVWSAGTGEKTAKVHDESSADVGGGSSPMLMVGLAAGGVGLLALAAGGGGGGGESGGGTSIQSVPDAVAPTITSTAVAPAIAENSGAGQVVYTTTATDAGTITYSLKAGGDAAAFIINGGTGAVTLTGNPDFEAKSSYNFTVVATDATGNSAERAVSLAINDLSDSGPPVTITSGGTAAPINENSGAQQVVYTVTATGTGAITYSLKPGGDAAAFGINANTGTVILAANPDDEAKSSYEFTVVATDAARNSSERAVSLNIIDLDEVAPTITSGATATALNENTGSNQIVYTVTSTDTADISTGNTTYRLKAGGDAGAFGINTGTGAVRLTANPDFEAKSSYHFTVVATDVAGNSAERAVSLAILDGIDLDRVAPTITSGGTATAINENSGSNQIIYTVTSTDNDDINDGNTTYSLKPGGDADAFSINPTNGAVRLTANPDFEAKSSYHFTVVATDAAHNSSEQAVSLAINDIADTVDQTPPAVDHVALTGAVGRENGILDAGDKVSVTVTMTENTQVNTSGGTPSIELRIGNDKVDAGYVSGSGSTSLIFEYTIQQGDADKDGISIASNALDRNGGSITDAAGNGADLKNEPVGSNPLFVVDTQEPHSFSPGDNAPLNLETGESIFGLTQSPSADTGRSFQSSVSEDIEVRVAGGDATPSTVASGSEWGGSANLGTDERVMLAGNGADSPDPSPLMTIAAAAVAEQSSAGSDPGLQGTSLGPSTPFGDGAVQTNIISFTDIAIGLTSQGVG